MSARSIIVAGAGSNVGKTTVTLGLMAAFVALDKKVQGFKCGPDYIDPSFQTLITGRSSHNLDSWMCEAEDLLSLYEKACADADLAVIEGVMGLFDGKSPLEDTGSTVEIARLTQAPILLVVDCSGVARSAAAIVKGFQMLAKDVEIVGVVANFVGGKGHFELIQAAVAQVCDIPVLGYLTEEDHLKISEGKHGLSSVNQAKLRSFEETFIKQFNLHLLMEKMGEVEVNLVESSYRKSYVRIGVIRDECFPFYYEANLQLLRELGANIIEFSLLEHEDLPEDLDGLYIGGGYPELFPKAIKGNHCIEVIKDKIEAGLPTYAEALGLVFLLEKLILQDGQSYPMLGALNGVAQMKTKLANFGYREIAGHTQNPLLKTNELARGHAFHYSDISLSNHSVAFTSNQPIQSALKQQIVASDTYLHFYSQPMIPKRFIQMCYAYQTKKVL